MLQLSTADWRHHLEEMQDNLTSLASLPSVHVRQNYPEDGRFLVSSIGYEKKGEPRKGAGRLEPMRRRRTMQLILGGTGKAKKNGGNSG